MTPLQSSSVLEEQDLWQSRQQALPNSILLSISKRSHPPLVILPYLPFSNNPIEERLPYDSFVKKYTSCQWPSCLPCFLFGNFAEMTDVDIQSSLSSTSFPCFCHVFHWKRRSPVTQTSYPPVPMPFIDIQKTMRIILRKGQLKNHLNPTGTVIVQIRKQC